MTTRSAQVPTLMANLDWEAKAAHRALPQHVIARLTALAPLMRAVIDAPACHIVLPGSWTGLPEEHPNLPTWKPADPAAPPDLVWAAGNILQPRCPLLLPDAFALSPSPDVARRLGARKFGQEVARSLGYDFPSLVAADVTGALQAIASVQHWPGARGWIAKARLSAAGRDRVIGECPGPSVAPVPATMQPWPLAERALTRLLQLHREVIVEPWVERTADFGTLGAVDAHGTVTTLTPHGQLIDERGGFLGIVRAPTLTAADRAELTRCAHAVGAALASAGHRGPFSVDAFAYRANGAQQLRALCEINPRMSFGLIAHALFLRSGHGAFRIQNAPPRLTQPTTQWIADPATKLWIITEDS